MITTIKFALGVPLALFMCSYLYREQESVCGWLLGMYEEEDALLVIGILSAQKNSVQRKSIRDTWTTLINSSDVKYYFLIGKDVCPVHPTDRKSNLSCEELDIRWPKEHVHHPLNWTSHILQPEIVEGMVPVVTSFTFRVNYPLVLRRAKVLSLAVSTLTGVRLNLKDARTGYNLMTDTIYINENISSTTDHWISVSLQPFILPKGYDIYVELLPLKTQVISKLDKPLCHGKSLWFDFYGAIGYSTQYGFDTGTEPFSNYSCAPVALELELLDLKMHLGDKENRRHKWRLEQETLLLNITSEESVEKDILLLDVLDVYMNLPIKMLLFYQWLNENLHPAFVLKTDDDTFLDVSTIVKFLRYENAKAVTKSRPYRWWWAKLRHGLPVDRFGKWQELKYRAPVYPPFPCGGGYVLSQDIVQFLGSSAKWLHPFQGEDTSLGIWLSGLLPAEPSGTTCEWTCDSTCSARACNRGQLTTADMYVVWDHYQRCQNMCGCHTDNVNRIG